MRLVSFTWGIFGLGLTAAASPVFHTVVDNVNGAPLTDVAEIAVGPSGHLASVASSQDGAAVIYAAGSVQTLASSATPLFPLAGQGTAGPNFFDGFTNLALSRDTAGVERVTFLASPGADVSATVPAGIYQYNLATSHGIRILSTGDPAPGPVPAGTFDFNNRDSADGTRTLQTIGFQANAAGKVLFGGTNGANEMIVLGSATTATRIADDSPTGPLPIAGFNQLPSKKVLTANGNAVFVANTDSGRQLIQATDAGALSIRAAGGSITDTQGQNWTLQPTVLHGANSNGELFQATLSSAPDVNDGAIVYHDSSSDSYRLLTRFPTAPIGFSTGVMTDAGKAAFITPQTDDLTGMGASIWYFDGSAIKQVAQFGQAVGGYTLSSALRDLSNPMVNDQGWVVFDAWLMDESQNMLGAILAWNPADAELSPQIIAVEGGELSVDGTLHQIGSILPLRNASNMFSDGAANKASLSSDGHLAFAVQLDRQTNPVIVMTQVPEPTGLLPLLATGFILRRRRRA